VTLTFDGWPFTVVSGHTWRVTWSTPPPSLKIPRLSILELWVLTYPIGYRWQCVCSHCACAVSRDLCAGANFSRIFEIPDPDLPTHYTTFMALRLTVVNRYGHVAIWWIITELANNFPRWWGSVKGFRGGGWSKFSLLHWLWASPLQHSRTTVRVCDCVLCWTVHCIGLCSVYIGWSDVTYLWSRCDRHFVGQHVVLCVVKWWRFVALFE